MRVFVSDLHGHVGRAVRRALADSEHDIVGTIQSGEDSPGKVAETAEVGSPEAEDLAFNADAVIVTLTDGLVDAKGVVNALRRDVGEAQKLVIGISTVMTWARCPKPAEGEKLSENSYKSRKPSPKYADYRSVESYIMNLAREGVQSCVVATGILYGGGEDMLHSIFKEAWECEGDALAIPAAVRGGENVLPMLHVQDLAKLAVSFLDTPPEKKYLVAVDQANHTLTEVVTAVSTSLGPGKVRVMDQSEAEEALILRPGLPELQVDLAFDVDDSVVGAAGIEWTAQSGFVENVATVVEEYISERNVRPLRIAVMGPPASGKTSLSQVLAKKYYLPHVTAKGALDTVKEQETELAAAVNEALAAGDGRLPPSLFCKAVRSVLEAPKMRNRGYVLDGLPRTFTEARLLFAEVGEEEEDAKAAEEDEAITVVPAAVPTAVITLEGEEELFADRIRALSEEKVDGTHNTEEGFNRRMKAYAQANSPEDPRATVVFFEKFAGLDTLTLKVATATPPNNLYEAAAPYIEKGGKPYNYHPTPEEIAAARAEEEERKAVIAAAAAKSEADRLEAERKAKAEREAEERQRMDEIARQEAQLLEARSAPLRGYLMENVIPTLTKGLLEVCKVNPTDPIDYLAEFLFKNSPTSNGSEYEAKLKSSAQ